MERHRFFRIPSQAILGALLTLAVLSSSLALPLAPEALATANNSFAFDLFRQLAREQPGTNIFISPFSVSCALQMAANGAAGQTRTEMLKVLKTSQFPAPDINAAFRDLQKALLSQKTVTLTLANSMWVQQGFTLKPSFTVDATQFFQAEVANVDFGKQASARLINTWADKQTKGRVKDIVQWPFDPDLRLILANAIYFKGKWAEPFKKDQTKPRIFHSSVRDIADVPMMTQHRHFSYQENAQFQAVQLAYSGDRLYMDVFLPRKGLSPQQIITNFSGGRWKKTVEPAFDSREGTLVLPRFKTEYQVLLNHALQAMGMKEAFDSERANFAALAPKPLYISKVLQKSFVEANEEGTEAAAVTGLHLVPLSAAPADTPKPFEMIVDRPFLFVIEDHETGAVLFTGIIADPSK